MDTVEMTFTVKCSLLDIGSNHTLLIGELTIISVQVSRRKEQSGTGLVEHLNNQGHLRNIQKTSNQNVDTSKNLSSQSYLEI